MSLRQKTSWIAFDADWVTGEWRAVWCENREEAAVFSEVDSEDDEHCVGLLRLPGSGGIELVKYRDPRGKPKVLAKASTPLRGSNDIRRLVQQIVDHATDTRTAGVMVAAVVRALGVPSSRMPPIRADDPSLTPPPTRKPAPKLGCLFALLGLLRGR